MKQITAATIRRQARVILEQVAAKHPEWAEQLRGMKIRVSGRMTSCAGKYNYRNREIILSLPFFADPDNFSKEFFETVTHEAAHGIVGVGQRNGKPHGPIWQRTHRMMGGTGKRTHSMNLADGYSKRKRSQRTEAPCGCGCGQPMKLGPTQYKRHLQGVRYCLKGHRRMAGGDGPETLRRLLSF
jgi:predicted SprT family Zn-dependent metalloprotease